MLLQMAGIDYEKAGLDIRSLFSFQDSAALEAMPRIKERCGADGVVIISTCNRTEVYISAEEKKDNLFGTVCSVKNASENIYEKYAVKRCGADALHHLFLLACGMKSQVFGEDQIITQVKNALFMAREAGTTDGYMERVFQGAVAAAKKVKTEVRLTSVNVSVAEEMKKVLKEEVKGFKGKKCLVIGNGEIGRLTASGFVNEGADVTVTVRNYKTRQVEIPAGCKVVDYKDRYKNIAGYDIIASATTSPHHTIKYEDCHQLFEDGRHHILADLAVPRDISSQFGSMENISLYNIDSLGTGNGIKNDNEATKQALVIIKEYENKIQSDENVKGYITAINNISSICGNMVYEKVKRDIKKENKENKNNKEDNQDAMGYICISGIESIVKKATEKTVSSMLFELKKNLPPAYFSACINAIEDNITR